MRFPCFKWGLTLSAVKIQSSAFRTLLVAATLVAAPWAHGQKSADATVSKHSLWKVQGKQNTLYLLGSIHVLKKEDYP